MSNQGSIRTDGAARDELRQRCLSLVRRWQPLAQGGWDRNAARQLGDELDQVADTSERLGLEQLNGDALELAAYLCSFIDDALVPNARDLQRLAEMVEALGADLTDLSATAKAAVHTLPSARISAEIPVVRSAVPAAAAPVPPTSPAASASKAATETPPSAPAISTAEADVAAKQSAAIETKRDDKVENAAATLLDEPSVDAEPPPRQTGSALLTSADALMPT